jgi:hypothetical protein
MADSCQRFGMRKMEIHFNGVEERASIINEQGIMRTCRRLAMVHWRALS